jgi:hypothetical protein
VLAQAAERIRVDEEGGMSVLEASHPVSIVVFPPDQYGLCESKAHAATNGHDVGIINSVHAK